MAQLQFLRPMPPYYGHGPVCPPDPSCLPIPVPKWPTKAEYDQVMKIATATFAKLTWQLARDYNMGAVRRCNTLAQAKRAWLWFYALSSFNPLLFQGNLLTAEEFWKITERVYEMRKSCGSS